MISTSDLPSVPGCYIFKNSNGKVIYIGKARNIKKRVLSYFAKNHEDEKTTKLVENISDVDFYATDNEIEALVLESNLIKKYQPKYNILLKDSKRYAYLLLTDEDFPRLVLARKKTAKGSYFGPFVSGQERDYVKQFINKNFRLRTCKRMPKRPCLRYHINLCDAPCIGNISKNRYDEKIRTVKNILRGNVDDVQKKLKVKISLYSKTRDYEKAMELRDQSSAISYLTERQNMERSKKYDEDIINYIVKNGSVHLLLFNIYRGMLAAKHEFIFDRKLDFLDEFITRYYSENEVPKVLIVPKKIDNALEGFLSEKRGNKVRITVPKIGEKRQLLELVKKNVEITFFGGMTKLEELQKALKLNDIPVVIECFDISHISGTSTVGSMVQFRNAKPDKSNYRRFKIRSVEGVDDFASIAEVVRRRYKRLLSEKQPMPNLIIIDGGKGQLSSAIAELKKLNLRIPIIGIAKRDEEIFFPGLSIPLKLDKKTKALRFVQEIRDEAHRFAIKYNRLLRSKNQKN